MAAENFKVKKGLEVGTAITATSSGVNVTGVVTATQFVGDGSGLTGVTGSGSGVVIKHDGSAVGTASTINFSTNLDVSAISAGIVTITALDTGISSVAADTTPQLGGNLDLDGKFINGTGGANITGVVTATTFVGNGDFVNLDVDGETDLDDLSVAGVSTFTGTINANGGLVGNATKITLNSSTTDSSFPVLFSTGVIGSSGADTLINSSKLTFNPSSGTLTATSADITGDLDVDGQTDLDDVVVAGVSTFNDGITLGTNSTTFAAKFADDAVANFGTDNDLQISHDNSNALISNSTGKIVVVGVVSATSGANITGVVTATTFSGSGASLTNLPSGQLSGALPALDGSALTGVTASGSGVIVKHDGTTVGTAGTINFSTNLDVSAVSAGIVTITASGGGGGGNASTFTVTANNSTDETVYPIFVDGATGSQGAESDTNLSYNPSSNILTAGTFSGNLSGTVNTAAQTSITSLGTLSALTVSGDVTANGNIVGDNSTNISGIASVTATSFHGSGIGLTSLDADNLGSGIIPNGRFPATLPAASGANLTSLTAGNISGTLATSQIADEAITFAKMQHINTGLLIGRNDGSAGDIETLTASEVRTLLNVADGATAGITTANTNFQVTWTVTASGQNYRFTGPGNDGTEDFPDLYLVRGQRYRFIHNATSSHPLQIQTTGGSVYTDGVVYSHTNETRQGNNLDFNVQHDAPAHLTYNCTAHPSMEGNIYIVGQHLANGANNRVLTATSAYGINAESNMTFDGDDLTISHSGLAVNIFESTDNHSRLRIKSADASQAQLEFADQSDADAGEIRYNHATDKMTFHVYENGERVAITSTGQLNLAGNMQFTAGNPELEFNNGGPRFRVPSANTLAIHNGGTLGSSNNEVIRIKSDGNVGIGTTNPTTALEVKGDITVSNVNNQADIFFGEHGDVSDSKALIRMDQASSTAGELQFHTENGGTLRERVKIQTDGGVIFRGSSVNTTNTEYEFLSSNTSPYLRLNHTANNANHTFIQFRAAGSEVGEIRDDGDGTITYATSSDYRLKENVVDLSNAITRLKNLKPKRFNFKVAPSYTKDGFLAHELQEVVPEAVQGTKDELVTETSKANNPSLSDKEVGDPVYQTADISRVVPLLTAALQEAITEIETLKAKVSALEGS